MSEHRGDFSLDYGDVDYRSDDEALGRVSG